MNLKTILTVGAVAFGSSLIFGGRKVGGYTNAIKSLQFEVVGLRNIKLRNGIVSFDVDIKIINPTPTAIDVPGQQITIKTLHFFSPTGAKLGVATPNLSDIKIPANGFRLLTNVPTQISLVTAADAFSEVLAVVSDPSQLRTSVELEVLGQSFIING